MNSDRTECFDTRQSIIVIALRYKRRHTTPKCQNQYPKKTDLVPAKALLVVELFRFASLGRSMKKRADGWGRDTMELTF